MPPIASANDRGSSSIGIYPRGVRLLTGFFGKMQIPEKYRTVLILRDIEDLDTEQTGRVLELTVPAVKTRLHRARLALKGLLDQQFAADGVRVPSEPEGKA